MIIVAGSVAIIELAGRALLSKTPLSNVIQDLIIGVTDAVAALLSYIVFFRYFEKRKINELSVSSFNKNAFIFFLVGFIFQSLFVLIIYLNKGYAVTGINSASFFAPAFAASLTAGFVAEIILTGIIFRIVEEISGTWIALIIMMLLFAIIHLSNKEATFLSVTATVLQAGFLLPATYIFTRSLWAPVFLHFAWDFTEPGIYGGINPGNSIAQSLFTAKITGADLITGGHAGPQNSIQACLICLVAGSVLLWGAKQKKRLVVLFKKRRF
jgi:membrane protease YdiL (CAAX protease family)